MVHLNITKILNNIYLKFPEFSSYRPQRSCGKVMFLHLSMGVSVHGGGGWGRGLCLWGSLSCRVFVGGECLCPGASLSGGSLSRGVSVQGVSVGETPLPRPVPPYDYVRSVCILLEWILVFCVIFPDFSSLIPGYLTFV